MRTLSSSERAWLGLMVEEVERLSRETADRSRERWFLDRREGESAGIRTAICYFVGAFGITVPDGPLDGWLPTLRALAGMDPACTSDDPTNHQGDTCPVHEAEE